MGTGSRAKLAIYCLGQKIMELHLHFSIRLHGVVLNELSTEEHYLYYDSEGSWNIFKLIHE
jgi:hypothetical protein